MLRIYCPICNGLLRLEDGQKEAVCINCGTRVAVPQGYTEAESSYLFAAEAMQRRDFEGAYQAYTEILAAHPEQAEALRVIERLVFRILIDILDHHESHPI